MFPPATQLYSCLLALLVSWGIGFLTTSAHAGCARERLDYREVDVAELSGISKAKLILLPKSYWSYELGVMKVSFISPVKTCHGPQCKPMFPLTQGLTAIPINSTNAGQSFVCSVASIFRFESDFSSHKMELDQSVEVHNPFILERPPRV